MKQKDLERFLKRQKNKEKKKENKIKQKDLEWFLRSERHQGFFAPPRFLGGGMKRWRRWLKKP